jgi:hypothetical protein
MCTIGFRAEADGVCWAVVTGDRDHPALVAHGRITAPQFAGEAEGLSFVRNRVEDVLETHKPDGAYIRAPETFGRRNQHLTSLDKRLRIEGVVMEVANSLSIRTSSGPLRSVGKSLESSDPKAYLGSDDVRGLVFPKKDTNCKEAILAAVAGLEGSQNGNPRTTQVPAD